MDNNWLNGHEVPIIDRGQMNGHPDPQFAQKNEELQGNMGNREDNGENSGDVRKSELIEIPTTSARVIYRIHAIFPFDLFPDEIVIDEIKVSMIYKYFLSRQINNILIKDVTDITLDSTLFFGSLLITGGEYEGGGGANEDQKGPLTISRLWLKEAQTARQIILGLMILSDQKVDTTRMSVEEIFSKTAELGNSR